MLRANSLAGVARVVVFPELPDSSLATRLLLRYYQELDCRFPDGFDLDLTVAVAATELVAPQGTFLVAYLDGRAVGCGAARMLDARTAEIKRMWIDPTVRGRGVGSRLLAALEARVRELGCQSVRLDTSAHLTEALALYRSHDYSNIPAYNNNPYAAHWLEKQLI